jgi:hypothetical protein
MTGLMGAKHWCPENDRSPVTDLPWTSPRQRSVPTRGSPGWRRRGRVFRRGRLSGVQED